jgi:hypothetical protein
MLWRDLIRMICGASCFEDFDQGGGNPCESAERLRRELGIRRIQHPVFYLLSLEASGPRLTSSGLTPGSGP